MIPFNFTHVTYTWSRYAMIALTLRVNVVGYDYTGYGASMEHGIPPTEKQTYTDIERVYEWCIESKLVKVSAILRYHYLR